VFRDGDGVRDESGLAVSRDIIRAEAVSPDPAQWEKFSAAKDVQQQVEARRERLQELGEKMKNARVKANNGKLSDKEMDEFKGDLEKALAAESQPLAAGKTPAVRDKTFQTHVSPTTDFTATALGASPDKADADSKPAITRPSADVSAPSIP
jgi:hypothetical protein